MENSVVTPREHDVIVTFAQIILFTNYNCFYITICHLDWFPHYGTCHTYLWRVFKCISKALLTSITKSNFWSKAVIANVLANRETTRPIQMHTVVYGIQNRTDWDNGNKIHSAREPQFCSLQITDYHATTSVASHHVKGNYVFFMTSFPKLSFDMFRETTRMEFSELKECVNSVNVKNENYNNICSSNSQGRI